MVVVRRTFYCKPGHAGRAAELPIHGHPEAPALFQELMTHIDSAEADFYMLELTG